MLQSLPIWQNFQNNFSAFNVADIAESSRLLSMLLRLFQKKNLLRMWKSFVKGMPNVAKSQRMSRMMQNLQHNANVQLQVFRVLQMTQRFQQPKEKRRNVANVAELSKCCRNNNKCFKYVRSTRSAGLTMQ